MLEEFLFHNYLSQGKAFQELVFLLSTEWICYALVARTWKYPFHDRPNDFIHMLVCLNNFINHLIGNYKVIRYNENLYLHPLKRYTYSLEL